MFLTYSVLFGICFNFIINSGVVLVGAYFPNKNQALATGLASSGMSFGSLLSNVISEVIVTRYGWRRRIQIFASIIFVIGIPCVATFKPAVINTSPREENSATITIGRPNRCEAFITLCKTPSFYLWLFATLCWGVSYFLPTVFLIDYMESIDIPSATGAWVLTVYGVASFIGRILGAVFGEKIMAYGSRFGEDSCRRFSLAYVYVVCSVIAGLAAMLTPQWKLLGVVYAYIIGIVLWCKIDIVSI
ncbi:uncharacterized protein LOC104265451 [Ciona intestinalis]